MGQIASMPAFIIIRYLKYKENFLSFLNFIKQNKTKNQLRKRYKYRVRVIFGKES